MLVKINHGEILRKLLIYHNKKIQNSNMIRMIRMYSVEPNPILYILRSNNVYPQSGVCTNKFVVRAKIFASRAIKGTVISNTDYTFAISTLVL